MRDLPMEQGVAALTCAILEIKPALGEDAPDACSLLTMGWTLNNLRHIAEGFYELDEDEQHAFETGASHRFDRGSPTRTGADSYECS